MERVNKIELGLDLRPEERREYEDLLCKYIHLFAFKYKDFKENHHGVTQNWIVTKCQIGQDQTKEVESNVHYNGEGGTWQVVSIRFH